MATLKDIADELGISPSTVSRALNGSPQIPEKTAARVRAAAARLGYRAHAQAAALRTGNTRTVGLLVSSMKNPYFSTLAFEVEEAARAWGYTVMLASSEEDGGRQEQALESLLAHQPRGLIFVPAAPLGAPLLQELSHLPVVTLDRTLRGASFASVVPDSSAATDELATLLKERGYRRPACILGPRETSTGAERARNLERALEVEGFEHAAFVHCAYDRAAGYQTTRALLSGSGAGQGNALPDALICGAGVIALGALEALRTQGLALGTDMGLATFDDLDWMGATTPSLTAIDTPVGSMARDAVDLLHALIEGDARNVQKPHAHPARLIVRESLPDRKELPPFRKG